MADRLVEVIADGRESAEPQYRYGSGLIVRGRTVLTAAHVVADAETVRVRDPDKKLHPASVRLVGDPDGPGPDLALVEIDDQTLELPPIGLARVDRNTPGADPVERCHAIGYPWFAETRSPETVRETVDAIGVVPVLSKLTGGLLSVQVSDSPRPLPPEQVSLGESEWSGMSGAAVVADGMLLGVVVEHAPREGPSAITAVPLTAIEPDPDHPTWGPGVEDPAAWWSQLGVTGAEELQWLPPKRPGPPYWSTLREFGQALHQRMPQLLGREHELAEIASFATGSAGYRWLVGGAFAGKTALLFEAVMGLPSDVDVVSYFLSRRASDADSNRFLAAVVPQLAYLCDSDPPTPDRYQFDDLWRQAAERAAESGRHLLLVVDGLDEDLRPAGSPSVARLLPTLVAERTHVLVASRPYPELPPDVPEDHPLRATSPAPLEPFVGAGELAGRAREEIDSLTRGDDPELAVDVLGLLTAAAGPLTVRDLADLSNGSSAARRFQVGRLVTERAARSLEPVGSEAQRRYQFTHYSLLEYAQENEILADPEFRERINDWAERWRERGWPTTSDVTTNTPRYLLDNYTATLSGEPELLATLVGDAGWVDAAIQSASVDRVLADLRRAATAIPAHAEVKAMLAVVQQQAHQLRAPHPLAQPGYVSRQLCLQALELGEDRLADQFRARAQSQPGLRLAPLWTTHKVTRALLGELGRHHADAVGGLAVLPNGQVVSAGGYHGLVLLWHQAEPNTQALELGRHGDAVGALVALPNGQVVSGGDDGRLLLWDPAEPNTQALEFSGRHGDAVGALVALPNGQVVSGGGDGRLLLWDPAEPNTQALEFSGRHEGWVGALAALPDGRVVSGGVDGRLLAWDPAEPNTQPLELGRHEDRVQELAALPDGRVVSGSDDGCVLLWDPAEPHPQPLELGCHDAPVRALAALLDGRVISGDDSDDGRLLLWDPAEPSNQPLELGRHESWLRRLAALPDGRVVGGDADGRLLLWDPAEPTTQALEPGRPEGWVLALAALPNGQVVGGDEDGRVLLWDPAEPTTQALEFSGRHEGSVRALAALPNGRVVSGGDDGCVLLWDPAEAHPQPLELGRHEDGVLALAALSDGRVVSGSRDKRVLVWDPAEPNTQPLELGRHESWVQAVAALPNGRMVSGGSDERVLVWNLAEPNTQPLELARPGAAVLEVAALPDGQVVSGGTDGRVLAWEPVEPNREPLELGHHEAWVVALAALPNGRVVSSGNDGRVLLWNVATQSGIAQVNSSSDTLVVLDDGTSLLFAHPGGGLSLWSLADGPLS